MIFGIGTDFAQISRFEKAYQKRGDRFANAILTPNEFATFTRRHTKVPARGYRFLATRFAAKEAFSKACGLGIRMPMHWHNVQVENAPSGTPTVRGLGAMATWLAAQGEQGLTAHLSISDEADYCVAYVVLEYKVDKNYE